MGYSWEAALTKQLIVFQLSNSLPESSRAWHTQLCSAYFTALVMVLVYQMLNGCFKITLLVNLDMKSKQLDALQEVGDSETTKYKALEEEENILNKNFALY